MVSMEDLFFTLIIDTHEGRKVATFDVPGAYSHADIPKYESILMKLRGNFVDTMCQVNPEYDQNVRYENGKRFCIFQLLGKFMIASSMHCCGISSPLQC